MKSIQASNVRETPDVRPSTSSTVSNSRFMGSFFGLTRLKDKSEKWMVGPKKTVVGLPGLEYLSTLDTLYVRQKIQFLEIFTGWDTRNQYTVQNNNMEKLFHAVESRPKSQFYCVGAFRAYDINIIDNSKKVVVSMHRSANRCFPEKRQVFSPATNRIGAIEEQLTFLRPWFNIRNRAGDKVLYIRGPSCPFWRSDDLEGSEFKILAEDKSTVIGTIRKLPVGMYETNYRKSDDYAIDFPVDLDVVFKAILLCSVFLIDFKHYQ
ncbi:Scramblase [Nesidiocoris tenuis]|uniref:Phospholipid scramblase n=1 Tax=Nesidiocoris tenuis TaxID=355587 RepID=A0ABN7B749_9HEMI|nr:Scramblase [Nesidiocoris tenuis]